jgi:hypothetical protein
MKNLRGRAGKRPNLNRHITQNQLNVVVISQPNAVLRVERIELPRAKKESLTTTAAYIRSSSDEVKIS